jgi:DNA polymerase elongation subunit (family B)
LDAIAEYELHERKTVYEGTLDQLYHDDFAKFVEYNRQDCALLNKLDNKLKFIDIANEVAHEIGVLIPTTMGVVSATDQAIINEAHKLGFCIKDRVRTKDLDTQAAGAYVAYPKKGLHDWVGLLDVKSLYPSVIRAMNMSPETIVGQLRQTDTENFIQNKIENGTSFATAWEGLFGSLEFTAVLEKDKGKMITVDWENGTTDTLSGAEIHELIYNSNQPYMLSANGTIFTYSKEGVIPGILTKWYSDRQTYQKNLQEAIEKKDKVAEEHWDKRQQVTKIQLNSLYGALLNAGSRFFDKRLGQSVTLTGRQVVKHMSAKVNEIITGFYDYKGESVKYNDSVTGDTMIRTDGGQIPIKELYEQCCQHVIEYGKEYGVQSFAKVVGFNAFEDSPVMSTISYVMRHKTKKKLYKITLQNDKSVTVTEDHSVMVDRAGFLLEVTPLEIKDTDLIICLNT